MSSFCSTISIVRPLARSFSSGLPDLRDDQRREAEKRLVEEQQARLAHQRAADRQHLLLAAGQRSGGLLAPLGSRGNRP